MEERLQFYIDGRWVDPGERRVLDVVNPATEEPFARIALGAANDVDRAVAAARRAFESFSRTSREERLDLLRRIVAAYQKRYDDLVQILSREMGAPLRLSRAAQVATGVAHLNEMLRVLESYDFEQPQGTTMIRREPIGVCGFITPWNWPVNQIMCKVAPALAAGCTMVLKPTEIAPLNALILAEVFHDAGVPAGVFNLVNGDGPTVGQAIAAHPDVDMVSFTGSTRAGVLVAKAASDSVKRVTQELGGKSPNVILDDADLERAVAGGVAGCMTNSGQSCNAPTRMLVPESLHDRAAEIARAAAEKVVVGDPFADGTTHRPGGERDAVEEDPAPDPARHRPGGGGGHRRSRAPAGAGARLLRAPHGLRRRAQRHDDRARGDLRARFSRCCRTGTRRTPSASPTTPPTASPPTSPRAISSAPAGWHRACAPARCS